MKGLSWDLRPLNPWEEPESGENMVEMMRGYLRLLSEKRIDLTSNLNNRPVPEKSSP